MRISYHCEPTAGGYRTGNFNASKRFGTVEPLPVLEIILRVAPWRWPTLIIRSIFVLSPPASTGIFELFAMSLTVAVEGCAHGNLDEIYDSILQTEKANGISVDLLLCCGDFQSIRNEQDMECLACPVKYREMVNPIKCFKWFKWKAFETELVLQILLWREKSASVDNFYRGQPRGIQFLAGQIRLFSVGLLRELELTLRHRIYTMGDG